jgi:protein-disulfide isomerase
VSRQDPQQRRRERRVQARLERAPRARGRRAPKRPAWQSPLVLVSVAAIAIGAAVILLVRPGAPRDAGELVSPPTSYPAALVDGDVVGAAAAPVVMELYSDFQCPACKLFVTALLPRLVSEFVAPGILRIEARDLDFLGTGNPSESLQLAVGAACAAEQDRYWQYHDLVFWNQGRENRGDHDAAFMARIADAAGVDRAAWDACIVGSQAPQAVRATTAQAMGAGYSSTPTLLVNGQKMVGVPAYDDLAALIRQLAGSPAPASPVPSSAP